MQLIIGRRSDPDKDDTQSWRSDHKPGGQLNGLPVGPKTPPPAPSSGVIIDRLAARPNGAVVELDEHGQKRRRNEGSTAVNHDPRLSQPVAHRRHEQELGQRIKCLEAKKTSLRSDDHERLAELNDMIAILGDQLKLLKSLTYVQEGPSFDETLIEVIEPSARNSEAARRRHEKDIERLHFDIVRRPEEGLREEEYEYRKKELQEDQRRYNVAEYDAGEAYQYQHGPSRGGLSQRPRSRADEVRAWLYDPGTEEGYEEARRQSGRPIPRHLDKHSPEPHGSDWSLVKEGPTQHQPSKQESVRFADEELFIRRPRPRATSWERTRPSIKSELDEDVLRGRELRASRQHQGGFITDATGSSRALVSRAGRHRSYAYPRDRVLLEDVDKTFGRRQAPRNPQKYRGDLSSEDDDFERKFMSRERAGPGIELSDNEVITKILNQFTTFQGNELPLLEKISPIVPTKNNEQTSSDSSLKQAADQQAAASTGATDIAQNRTDNEKQRSSGSSGTDDGRQRGRLRRRKSKSRGQDPNAAVAQPDLASGTASVILRRIIGWREPGDKDKGKADRGTPDHIRSV